MAQDDAEQAESEIKEYDSRESGGKGKYRDLQVSVLYTGAFGSTYAHSRAGRVVQQRIWQ